MLNNLSTNAIYSSTWMNKNWLNNDLFTNLMNYEIETKP